MHCYHAFLCHWDGYLLKKHNELYTDQMVPIDPLAHGLNQRWNRIGSSRSTGSRFVWVIRVRPGLKIIRVWPGLDHVSREIKKARYGSTMTAAAAMFTLWAMPTFRTMILLAANAQGAPPFISFMHMQSLKLRSDIGQFPSNISNCLTDYHFDRTYCPSHANELCNKTARRKAFYKRVWITVNHFFHPIDIDEWRVHKFY